jgi:predicted nucleic acid-binding Zn ribbon protein
LKCTPPSVLDKKMSCKKCKNGISKFIICKNRKKNKVVVLLVFVVLLVYLCGVNVQIRKAND